jgi:Cd2+/Zn2+-exporting ATPase
MKTRIDLNILLPDVADVQDACIGRIRDVLEAKRGVEAAHLIERPEGASAQLCVHFDSEVVSLQDIRQAAESAGAELQAKFRHVLADVAPMQARKARRLAAEISETNGVLEAAVSPDGAVRIEFDRDLIDEAGVRARLEEVAGVASKPAAAPAQPSGREEAEKEAEHAHGTVFGDKTELIFVALCGISLLIGWLLPKYADIPGWIPSAVLASSYFFGGFFTLREAIGSIRAGRFEIDFLTLVAAAGAAALGEWAEGALLLFLFGLGHALEAYAMERAKRSIEALAELAPKTALVRRDGAVMEVAVGDLRIGDTAIVKPNERLPADGFVVKGESSVNQAPITGESAPVDKQPVQDVRRAAEKPDAVDAASRVFAGTINGGGALEIRVTRVSADSTLARVVEMVREAETNQSPTQQFTDRFERIFVPVILAGAILSMFAWVVIDEPFSASFYRAMALLVAASPCALAIATPSAVLSGVARAARGGVLIKGGAPLENLGRLAAIAFDKTGTLTEGKPRLVDVAPVEGVSEKELLGVAVAVEALSDHPLAAAVVRDGRARLGDIPLAEASQLRSITGRGVEAKVDGEATHIGKAALFGEIDGPALPDRLRTRIAELEAAGRTTMVIRKGARYLGAIGLMDTPREAARSVVVRLRQIGIRRMIMISGDNQTVADAIARDIGIDEARGDLMPDDKVATIKDLRREAKVAMVGDGVNDAPAMANATVGIAMGAAGSDVALETADVALMADNLGHLPFAVGLSRATSRVIRQNLWFSLGIVAILVPSTVAGLGIGSAVLVHEGSTVVVVFNALRLLAFKDR